MTTDKSENASCPECGEPTGLDRLTKALDKVGVEYNVEPHAA